MAVLGGFNEKDDGRKHCFFLLHRLDLSTSTSKPQPSLFFLALTPFIPLSSDTTLNQASASAPGSRSGALRWPYSCCSGDVTTVEKKKRKALFLCWFCKKPETKNLDSSPRRKSLRYHRHLLLLPPLIQMYFAVSCIFLLSLLSSVENEPKRT